MRTGIIGGTGFEDMLTASDVQERQVQTDYGTPSSSLRLTRWFGQDAKAPVAFLSRHGFDHSIPPHLINYRANIMALKAVDAHRVVAIYAVGGIHPDMHELGHVVVPDQIIDYTYGRNPSFWDFEHKDPIHVDMTTPYSETLRDKLIEAAQQAGISLSQTATYACTNGPRLETAAEISRLAKDGCDIVGMTGMPEAGLAREAGLEFAALCVVVNPAAGLSQAPIDHDMIKAALVVGEKKIFTILDELFKADEFAS